MTIRDIARLAGVSVSTVSKVVNGKDENINQETRERVLQIVKKYNYAPYASVKNSSGGRTFLIGVMLNKAERYGRIVSGILECAHDEGYDIILCDSFGDRDIEQRNAEMLFRNRADGILWDPVSEKSWDLSAEFEKNNMIFQALRDQKTGSFSDLSYQRYGKELTQKLIDLGHEHLACVCGKMDADEKEFLEGFRKCLYENRLSAEEMAEVEDTEDAQMEMLLLKKITGVVTITPQMAQKLKGRLKKKNYEIPDDFSVISLCTDSETSFLSVTNTAIPFYEYGKYVCKTLISHIEKSESQNLFQPELILRHGEKIAPPLTRRTKKIIVVGNMNADIFLNVDECPQLGKVSVIKNCTILPGGKGVNQASGVARLGKEVALIGRIGKDMEGVMIYESLMKDHVNVKGILSDEKIQTGKAYIHVDKEGESGISIFSGANQNLCQKDLEENQHLFEGTAFCLLQTEIPEAAIVYAVKLAKKNGARIILKPSAVKDISDIIIREIDYFVPNRKEMQAFCPDVSSLEMQAEIFLKKGVGTVIITLGQDGCYVKNKEISKYFPAANIPAVDTTGGADAFISALAVYLSEEVGLETAIKYATCAAGFAVSRQGVVPALIDRSSLEMYYKRMEHKS